MKKTTTGFIKWEKQYVYNISLNSVIILCLIIRTHHIALLDVKLLDDFIDDDVSRDEKHFMKMWNRFMKSHTLISDSIIPQKCLDFIHAYGDKMVKLNLRRDLVLHLFNFWDSGIIPSANVMDCTKLFDKLSKEYVLAG